MNQARNYKQLVACELCGEVVCKIAWKQKRCKTCVPTPVAYKRAVRYGLSQPAFDALLSAQNGLCALCAQQLHTEHINGLHIDHDHRTGKVRGLLCGTCNTGIGHVERLLDKGELDKLLQYLKRTQ